MTSSYSMYTPQTGVCYYPEHWPEDMWAKDAADMAELGLSWVRIGEFAWSRLEPVRGDYDFDWLDRAIKVLGAAGLKVILGTPTATPPRWMLGAYPDMIAVDEEGHTRGFGSRRHYCFSYQPYLEECRKITEKLAQRYGKNSHIAAWQIDNEYGCHDTVLSYSNAAKLEFRVWLSQKYQDIDALNKARGNVFWSMEYAGFDDIDLPNQTVTEPNPSHVMDFRRFSSDQVGIFNRVQTQILRGHTDAPLIHNYMGRVTEFDHFDVGADLDIAGWDSYPMGFLEDRSDKEASWQREFMRQGDPDFQAFHHDLYSAVGRGRWWVMEQQPGPVNWAPYNPVPLPGMVRLWSWEAAAHGAEVVSYFRWRQVPFGQEQMHAGLQNPDGSPAAAWNEIAQFTDEIMQLDWDVAAQKSDTASVAIVFDYASCWAWDTQPQGQDFQYFRLILELYSALRKLGQNVDILPPNTSDFGTAKLVLIPGLFTWNDPIKSAMKSTQARVIIGPRSGSKTPNFHIPKTLPPDLEPLGVKITAVESLRPDASSELEGGGAFHIWQEFIEIGQGAKTERFRTDGQAAFIRSGNLFYLAGWPDAQAAKDILSNQLTQLGLEIEVLSEGLRRRDIGQYKVYVNYGPHANTIPSHKSTADQSRHEIAAAGVGVIDKRTGQRIL
ncbi:MAG: beta-galactosidase [Litorimonas sp.]